MKLLNDLIAIVPEGEVVQVHIGLHWTAVVTVVEGRQGCGLSSTLHGPHEHGGEPQVPQAGHLTTLNLGDNSCPMQTDVNLDYFTFRNNRQQISK